MTHLLFVFLLFVVPIQESRVEKTYDPAKNKTTIKMQPVQIAEELDKYRSIHMSPSFSYPGDTHQKPATIDFELQTIVKGRLRTDLYVVFIVDGETIFLSSSRQGIKRPVPGRVWMGERLIFHMPYETWLKINRAKRVEIKMDAVRFELGEPQREALRRFDALVSFSPG